MADSTGKRTNKVHGATDAGADAADVPEAAPDPLQYAEAEAWLDGLLDGDLGGVLVGGLVDRIMDEPLDDDELQADPGRVGQLIADLVHRMAHGPRPGVEATDAAARPSLAGAEAWIALSDHRPHFGDAPSAVGQGRGLTVSWSIPLPAAARRAPGGALSWAGDRVHVTQIPTGDGLASYSFAVGADLPAGDGDGLRVIVRPETGPPHQVLLTPAAPARTLKRLPADWRSIRLGIAAEPASGHTGRAPCARRTAASRHSPAMLESILLCHPGVRGAAVLESQGEDAQLVACVAAAGASEAGLRAHLEAHLPGAAESMAFLFVHQVPTTADGAPDRAALRALTAAACAGHSALSPMHDRPPVPPSRGEGGTIGLATSEGRGAAGTRIARSGPPYWTPPAYSARQDPALAPFFGRLTAAAHAYLEPEPPFTPPPRSGPARLSLEQERLYRLYRLDPASASGNLCFAVGIEGALEVNVLRSALAEVVRRHEVLRTTFDASPGEPRPVVRAAPAEFALPFVDLRVQYGDAAGRAVEPRTRDEAGRPFNLASELPLRALLMRVGHAEHVLVLTLHQAAADEWSVLPMYHEIAALYGAYRAGAASPLPEPAAQYADFADWQREAMAGPALHARLAYWREHLAGAPAVLHLPTDRPRNAARSGHRGLRAFDVAPGTAARVRKLARETGTSLMAVMHAAAAVLIQRVSGCDEVVAGTRVPGRARGVHPGFIGCFADVLPLRTDVSGGPSFRTLVCRVGAGIREALGHQGVPFGRLLDALRPEHTPGHPALVQIGMGLRDGPGEPVRLPGTTLRLHNVHAGAAGLDLFLEVEDHGGRLCARLHYAADLWEPGTAARMVHLFLTVLDACTAHPDRPTSGTDLIDRAERALLLANGRGLQSPYPRELTIHRAFAEVVERDPARTALVWDGGTMTYGELDARARVLATHLRRRGVRADEPVALVADRSPQLVAGILGILRAGGAYVPIDAQYPPDRIGWMLHDCGARVALVQAHLPAAVAGEVTPLVIDQEWDPAGAEPESGGWPEAGPESTAYVIYTSGSTGRPKGVVVPHRAVLRLVRGADYACFGADETWLQAAPASFDASTLEIWAPLLNGGRLAIFPPGPPTPGALAGFIARHGVTSAWLTAGLFHQVAESAPAVLGRLNQLLAGGDVLSVRHVQRVVEAHPRLRLINGYGPTENTTFSCCHTVRLKDGGRASIPVGRPIANSTAYVLDARLEPLPVGVPGELFVGGDGVARGYLNAPALTAERYVPDPFSRTPGARLYRTGDRARWRADGTLEFMGRVDQQAKIRGYRVEPREIEAILCRHPSVAEAVVQVRDDAPGGRQLVAYVVRAPGAGCDGARLVAEIGGALQKELPGYLQPSAIVPLDALPLTPSGKVDRGALPPPVPPRGRVEPRTPVETALAAIWAEVLHRDCVYLDDDFYELGGDSLLAIRVVVQVQKELGIEIPVGHVSDGRTLGKLAAAVEAAQQEAYDALLDKVTSLGDDPEVAAWSSTPWSLTAVSAVMEEQAF